MNKRFIEYDLPLAEISEASAREKNIRHGHPSTLHIWWARRPLAASRATAFAALIDDPGPHNPKKRREIRDLIEQITPWEAVKNGNSPAIKRAQKLIQEQYGDRPPKVLDPFAGGGSIPLEALRLGCETYASDYNPVAVFIEKATLEWPQKYGVHVKLPRDADGGGLGLGGKKVNLLAYLVEKWAKVILGEVRAEIGQFYPEEKGLGLIGKRDITEAEGWIPVGYLWTRTIPCQNPACGAEIPLFRQTWLAKKKDKKVAYRPVIDHETKQIDFDLLEGKTLQAAMEDGFEPSEGTVSRGNASCPVCAQVTKAKQTRRLAGNGKMGQRMVVVVLHHQKETGKKYRLATNEDMLTFQNAKRYLEEKTANWPHLESPLPDEEMVANARYMLPTNYGVTRWRELFNSRQQLALATLVEKINLSSKHIEAECLALGEQAELELDTSELAKVVIGYLGLLCGRSADYLSIMVGWINTLEAVRNTFSRQALSMAWDYIEVNPFSGSAGDTAGALNWILRYISNNEWKPLSTSLAKQSSATSHFLEDNCLDAVFTDPPYYDNVPYAALSDFFYVWLKRAVGEHLPDLFSTPVTPKA